MIREKEEGLLIEGIALFLIILCIIIQMFD